MTAANLLLPLVSLGSVDRCDTELSLSLSPGGVYHRSSDVSAGSSSRSAGEKAAAQQPITIFYNGQMCVCDVTEAQARAIISAAERETEAKKQSDRRPDSSSLPPPPAPAPPRVLNRSLSMKRSLQTFLQNRKTRAVDSSSPPYDGAAI
ncbi:hypothetical protein OPV22_029794 [Ensete ventricosum]|uniref:Protein TIFY n=1 Tax=Ensete ventricosum TaxID=4639 RepID=A0AAV8Q235_ENSVE|nr:hypothetical protein OPV22_029794 [Ensete ventricosum]